jgi:hypothetical protein
MAGRAQHKTNAIPRSLHVFIVPEEPNSTRMIETLKKIKCLHDVTTLINVLKRPYDGIDTVPTLLVDGRHKLVGTQAFEYLRSFDMELDGGCSLGSCSLQYSSIDGEAWVDDGSWYSKF